MALSAAKLSVAVRVAARQTERKANCFCELYLFLNKECSLGPPLDQGQGSQDMPTAPRSCWLLKFIVCKLKFLSTRTSNCKPHWECQARGSSYILSSNGPRTTGHGPQALMALLPSSSSWRFSIYYDFHILKNKYFIAALSKPAGKLKRTAKTLRIITRRAQTMHAKQINILVCRFLESLL